MKKPNKLWLTKFWIFLTINALIFSATLGPVAYSSWGNDGGYASTLIAQKKTAKNAKKTSITRKKYTTEAGKKNGKYSVELKGKKKPSVKVKTLDSKKIKEGAKKLTKKVTEDIVREELQKIYDDVDLGQTARSVTAELNALIPKDNKLTQDFVQNYLTDLAGREGAIVDTFVKGQIDRLISGEKLPKGSELWKELRGQMKEELKQFRDEQINKIAENIIAEFLPQLAGFDIRITDFKSEKALKAGLRRMAVTALAQSYLGPQYIAFMLLAETLFPREMMKVHAELRRFDKKYIQPVTDKVGDEWDRGVEKLKAELKRIEKKAKAELKRAEERIKKEAERAKKNAKKALKSAKKKLKKAF